MEWLSATVVGFLLVVAVVVLLARGSTARWERAKRAARAPRPGAVATPPPPEGAVGRLRRALVRTAGALPRLPGSAPERLRRVAGVLAAPRRLLPRVLPAGGVLRPLRTGREEQTPTEVPDAPVEGGDGGADPVEAQPRGPRWTRMGSGVLRRRRPFRFPHRARGDERSGDPGTDLERSREGSAPGARAEDRPGPG